MIVNLGLSNGEIYFLHDTMENPPRGLVVLDGYRTLQWCLFENILTINTSKFGIEKDGDQWVVCDWCNTPKGKLYAGVKWFDTCFEACEYQHINLLGLLTT